MPSTLESHKYWTRQEWGGETKYQYFPKVLDYLKNKEILIAIDCGGCTGEVSNIFIENIKSLKEMIIIEPILDNYNYILENVKSDSVNVLVYKNALYYNKKYINLSTSNDNVGGYCLDESEDGKVKTITLEELCSNKKIDFIKMDIEGAEKNVIENSSVIKDIKYIEIEFHNDLHENSYWKSFVKKYLPNHKIIFTDEDIIDSGSCCSHVLLEK